MLSKIEKLGYDTDVPEKSDSIQNIESMALSTTEYFVWSRVDGATSLQELFSLSGLDRTSTIEALIELADRGLICLPNRTTEEKQQLREQTSSLIPANWPTPFNEYVFQPSLLDSASVLPTELRRLILYYHHHLRLLDYYQLFQLERTASLKELREAYYRLSKVFHPDRWYGQNLGCMEEPLAEVFRWLNKAFSTLSRPKKSQQYKVLLDRGLKGDWDRKARPNPEIEKESKDQPVVTQSSQNRLRKALVLARARKLRASGDLEGAVATYKRALKLEDDVHIRYELVETLFEGEKELDTALDMVRELTKRNPDNYVAALLESKIQRVRGESDEAQRICLELIKRDPDNLEARDELKLIGESR